MLVKWQPVVLPNRRVVRWEWEELPTSKTRVRVAYLECGHSLVVTWDRDRERCWDCVMPDDVRRGR